MAQAIERNQIRLETGYEHKVNATSSSKSGYFHCSHGWNMIKVGFEADENGNIESLQVLQALDGEEQPIEFNLLPYFIEIKDQIEPMLWEDGPVIERDSMASLGFTNADFMGA